MLELFYSNRYEALSAALLDDLAQRPPDIWHAEPIIVPSAALRRRIELDYATRFGVCANVRFGYLAQWLWQQIGRVIEVPDQSPFAVDRLVWRVYRLLGAHGPRDDSDAHVGADGGSGGGDGRSDGSGSGGNEHAARLERYLAAADPAMRYELAHRIATVFDHYLTYRPEWLAAWQAGASIFAHGDAASQRPGAPQLRGATATHRMDEQWQAQLWRALLDEFAQPDGDGNARSGTPGAAPPAHRFLSLAPTLEPNEALRAQWPSRVSVVALPTMPPLHVALLRELSRWIDVRLYLLNPCRQYWFDIVTEKRKEELDAADRLDFQEVGHPLLAEWGRQTQAQLAMLHELTEGALEGEATRYEQAPPSTWLALTQNAILDLDDLPRPVPPPRENGVEVHVCHSLARQLEVLQDRLLAWFADDASLTPADVLVVVPELAQAAPLVDAIFGAVPSGDPRRIPYRITGLPASQANPLARVLLDWLALPERELAAPDLIEWLRVDAVATRYGIDPAALEAIQGWLAAAGARRGLSPRTHADPAVPVARHTFADALTRLFLGYAMPDGGQPLGDWLPIATGPGATGSDAELLGRLALFVDDIDEFAAAYAQSRTASQWSALLLAALERFFDAGLPFAGAATDLRDVVDDLCASIADGAPAMPLPAAVMRSALAATLDDPARGGVPWGGVTFSSLSSLRGVPFRIVCLLGMDDGVLPSVARADEFDLMASFGKLGDRQRRDDERNLFLDLVLAARDRLLIAYTGRNIRDDAPLPPAALVDDLLDYVARARAGDDASADQISQARASLVVVHPLQPFAAPYFEPGGMLFTYDADRAQIASALACPQRHEPSDAPRPFFSAPLPDRDRDDRAPGEGATIDFDDFERFWRHPIRALLRDRLGIALHEANAELSDTEPYALDYAGRDALAGRLLPALLPASSPALPEAGGDGAAPAATMRGGVHGDLAQRIARASHELPGGATGAVTRERELAALTQLAAGICDAYVGGVDHVEFTLPLVPRWPATVERVSPLLGAVGAIDRGGTLGAVGTAGAAGAPSGGASAGTDWLADVLAPVTLCGTLHGVTREGLVIYRYASPGARDYLGAWLRHLCWCVTRPDAPQRTLWLGDGVRFAFGQVDDPLTHLAELVALYRVGARVPLRFFPKSAWALVSLGEAKARAAWSGDFVRGESDDAALQLALRGDQLSLDETFAQIARAVFEPVRAHMIVEEAA